MNPCECTPRRQCQACWRAADEESEFLELAYDDLARGLGCAPFPDAAPSSKTPRPFRVGARTIAKRSDEALDGARLYFRRRRA